MKKILSVCVALFILTALSACGSSPRVETTSETAAEKILNEAIRDGQALQKSLKDTMKSYAEVAPNIRLGMSREEVGKILEHSQKHLLPRVTRQPEVYKKDGVLIEILYPRSGWHSDGLSTDDEYTPYIFHDGKLEAIGWATLGGVKTRGRNN